MNCFRAAGHAGRLVDHLLSAMKAAGNGKMLKAKSALADAALHAADLSKSGPMEIRKAAKNLSIDVFSLVNKPGSGVSVGRVASLREKAKVLKAASASACRS